MGIDCAYQNATKPRPNFIYSPKIGAKFVHAFISHLEQIVHYSLLWPAKSVDLHTIKNILPSQIYCGV